MISKGQNEGYTILNQCSGKGVQLASQGIGGKSYEISSYENQNQSGAAYHWRFVYKLDILFFRV